jgi:hypothetical protein
MMKGILTAVGLASLVGGLGWPFNSAFSQIGDLKGDVASFMDTSEWERGQNRMATLHQSSFARVANQPLLNDIRGQ